MNLNEFRFFKLYNMIDTKTGWGKLLLISGIIAIISGIYCMFQKKYLLGINCFWSFYFWILIQNMYKEKDKKSD